MAAEKTPRPDSTASAITQNGRPSISRNANDVRASVVRWLKYMAIELRGAVEDDRKWINSDRARALGTTFEVSGRLLVYVAYLTLAWLVFTSLVGILDGLTTGAYAIPAHIDGKRVALFNILAAGLVGPITIIAIGIGIGWMYNLTTASANWALPRFARPWVHPSILFAVVAVFSAFHSAVMDTIARGYLHAKANIEAASPRETASIVKIIEGPNAAVPGTSEATGHHSSGDREVARLRSMFESGRPCLTEAKGVELIPQTEAKRPEPGFAPNRDCQVEKQPRTNNSTPGPMLESANAP